MLLDVGLPKIIQFVFYSSILQEAILFKIILPLVA